ncbi:MAG TPA: RdgB/HAM1 family non-canonical purine NTP pyrophosphatase [Bacteroidales bacterium]|jgi:XTP/dITP diphosphohydrolase|nr:RdgB/HAM1 family non-canonical purine NTP pyrophosphatase [Bacteroidales bacterium]HOU98262.1 RdgB/HAM1 family non-canonical purine NTP pyrophosphatase [Bacteroidales bacterium]
MELIFASHNAHKAEEIRQLLPLTLKLYTLSDINYKDEIPETGSTLEENARIKAQTIFNKVKRPVFADDTGLEVEALGGAPGVYSARFAGEEGNAVANMKKLLKEMEGIENRKAQFRCCIVLIINNTEYVFNGIVRGTIALSPKGNNGFGYDPVFIPEGDIHTFAELPLCVKNTISHRTLAIKQMVNFLSQITHA